jgi:hypothetical protein
MTSDSPLRDFLGEVGWYQRRGIGANISRTELRELWKKAPTVLLSPNEFDNYGNFSPYGKEIVGNVEQRIAKFMKIATAESRDDVYDTKWARMRNENPDEYFQNLAQLIYTRSEYPPVNVIDVNGIRRFITGGRTRAAIGKVLEVPVLTKIIPIYHKGPFGNRAKKLLKIN